jgi:hypothetical protein
MNPKRIVTSPFRLIRTVLSFLIFWIILPALALWSTLAIYYSNIPLPFIRTLCAVTFLGWVALSLLTTKSRWRTASYFLTAFVIIIIWWERIPASNERDWRTEVAVLPWATIGTNYAIIYNIRDFDYASTTNFTIRYNNQEYNMDDIQGVDLALSYFGDTKAVGHTMLSFRFKDMDPLCLSVEVRRRAGDYGPIILPGFFKQYEIIYILGSERDLIRVRTNFRKEKLYLYPTTLSAADARKMLFDILWRVNKLVEDPEFYNTLTYNCTMSLLKHLNKIMPQDILVYRMFLLNGYSDLVVYEMGGIKSDLPFEEMKVAHLVTPIAQQYNDDPDFSLKIRMNLPGYQDMIKKILEEEAARRSSP